FKKTFKFPINFLAIDRSVPLQRMSSELKGERVCVQLDYDSERGHRPQRHNDIVDKIYDLETSSLSIADTRGRITDRDDACGSSKLRSSITSQYWIGIFCVWSGIVNHADRGQTCFLYNCLFMGYLEIFLLLHVSQIVVKNVVSITICLWGV
ncbi:hypothetical protein V1478_012497, partial [Vespula squamosa]